MRATLSLLGCYHANEDLFSEFLTPEDVDKENLIDNLLAECAELEILYTDPDMLQFMIGAWSKKELPVWEKLAETLTYEYDPIENYDRKEDWTDHRDIENSSEGTSGQVMTTNDTTTTNSTDTTSVAGFNGEGLATREQTASNGSTGASSTSNQTGNSTNSSRGDEDSKHTGRIHGNIGVTTTQHMIQEQRDIVEFNLIDYIISSFKKRFCLLIY